MDKFKLAELNFILKEIETVKEALSILHQRRILALKGGFWLPIKSIEADAAIPIFVALNDNLIDAFEKQLTELEKEFKLL